MKKAILTLNAGSSSVKFALFPVEEGALDATPVLKGEVSGIGDAPAIEISAGDDISDKTLQDVKTSEGHDAAIAALLDEIESKAAGRRIIGVGHRIVHGGAKFSAPLILTPERVAELEKLTPLAPSHQPHNLRGVAAVKKRWADIPQVACFDTAFHRTQPPVAEWFGLPRALTEGGVIRYGFHGLSYEYIASVAPEILSETPPRMIVAHLGAGASMCALRDGKSVATTMGFTALDGLPMATRCGDIDPGVLLYLLQEKGMTTEALSDLLYHQSGLLGASGISDDMRILEQSGEPAAREAIDYFVYRCVREIGALAAVLGGVDAIVFTAGIGENSSYIRKRVLEGCAWLGFEIDVDANARHERRISAAGAAPSAWAIPTNEELIIARHTLRLVAT